MITYAQNFEDVILERCFRDIEKGFYIDVGAWDPVLDSVTKHFYERGWNGINVEPSQKYALRLLTDRPRDVVLNVALGEVPGEAPFFELSEPGLSTLSQAVLDHHASRGFSVEQTVTVIVTLRHVCESHTRTNSDIHFLKIDVEGMEKAVIAGADWQQYRPWVVIVEATLPLSQIPTWEEWEPILLNSEYTFALFDGLNRFYVRDENQHLLEHFTTPPNCTDKFVPYRVVTLAQEVTRLKEAAIRSGPSVALTQQQWEDIR